MTTSSFPFDASRPIYEQIMDHIYNKIASGELGTGDKLDSVRELAYTVGVNPNTVSRAYMEMERKGIVETRRGQGTFVAMEQGAIEHLKQRIGQEHIDRLIKQMQSLGFEDEETVQLLTTTLERMNSDGATNR